MQGGTYTVTVTDANHCVATSSTTISSTPPLALSDVSQNVLCNGAANGVAQVNVSGGTSPFGYEWSNSATTASLTGVAAGIYSVTITDAASCTSTHSVTITEPTPLQAAAATTPVLCNGQHTGTVQLAVSGGVPGYTYAWDAGGSSFSLINVAAGNYSATITDANNCHSVQSVTISEPPTLQALFTVENVNCFGDSSGTIYVKIAGGVPSYNLVWSNGDVDTLIQGLSPDSYTLTITDLNGCTKVEQTNVVQPSAALAVASTQVNTPLGQSIGEATVNTTGGTAPYSVLWSNSSTSEHISSLAAGTYTYTVTDVNGCNSTGSVTITNSVGIGEVSSDINAEIYPNPTAGQLNVVLHLVSITDKVAIHITDVLGRVLSRTEMDAAKEMTTTLDLSNYPSGIYFVEVANGIHSLVRKVVLDK